MSTLISPSYNEYSLLSRLQQVFTPVQVTPSQTPTEIKNSKEDKEHSQGEHKESSRGYNFTM